MRAASATTPTADQLLSRQDTAYAPRNRIYRTATYPVDDTGTPGEPLTSNTWYDAAGNPIKQQPAGQKAFTKTAYDTLGRVTATYTGYDLDETTYAEATTLTGDTILEQREYHLDATGAALWTTLRQRMPLASESITGPLNNPEPPAPPAANPIFRLIPGMLSAALAKPKPKRTRLVLPFLPVPSAQPVLPLARVSYTAAWYDGIGRTTATANYGTCDGQPFTRPATVPERCDEILVTSTRYNDRGEAYCTTDPAGREQRQRFDDAGRLIETVDNFHPRNTPYGTPALMTLQSDVNRTVRRSYTVDGQLATLTAINPSTGDQVTRYVYGTALTDSAIAQTDLLRAEIYPDSDNTADPLGNGPSGIYDRIEYCYNRQGQMTQKKDQNETVHQYHYDLLGRQIADAVTALGENIDGAVQCIGKTYNARGLVDTLTSYSGPSITTAVVNQVATVYNALGLPIIEYQEHDGAVNMATTVSVGYEYSPNGRTTALVYPDGRKIHYHYLPGADDALNRVTMITGEPSSYSSLSPREGPGKGAYTQATSLSAASAKPPTAPAPLATYRYLGLNQVAQLDYPEPGIRCDYDAGRPGTIDGFDRFGRITDLRWWRPTTGEDIERIRYGYDTSGNPLWRECPVGNTNGRAVDELYTCDELDQLATFSRGRLALDRSYLIERNYAQSWRLDATGNWSLYASDEDGNGTWNNVVTLKTNAANEGQPSTRPGCETVNSFDGGGNLLDDGELRRQYDAWSRLVAVRRSCVNSFVGIYRFDSASRRIQKTIYDLSTGDPAVTVGYGYNTNWQVIEERHATAGEIQPKISQYVWGQSYIDTPIARRQGVSEPAVGSTVYYTSDGNHNVTALVAATSETIERYLYDAYGVATVCSADWTPVTGDRNSTANRGVPTTFGNEILFGGYRYDAETSVDGLRARGLTGAYHVRNREYFPPSGTFTSRDPMEADINLYRYLAGNPHGGTDPYGLWHLKDGSQTIYIADGSEDSLMGLSWQVTGDLGVATNDDWVSIWPAKGNGQEALWKGYPWAKQCAEADVSNLLPGTYHQKRAIMVSHPKTDLAMESARVFLSQAGGGYTLYQWPSAAKAVDTIKNAAQQGGNPIQTLVICGHSNLGLLQVGRRDGANSLFVSDILTLSGLHNDTNTYAEASLRHGPPRSWFARDAQVFVLGCWTQSFASEFATRNLRKGAFASGTTLEILGLITPLANGRNHFGISLDNGRTWYGRIQDVLADTSGAWATYGGGL